MNKLFVGMLGLFLILGVSGGAFAIGDSESEMNIGPTACVFYDEIFGNSGGNPFAISTVNKKCAQFVCPPAPTGTCVNGRTTCIDPTLPREWSCEFTCTAGSWGTGTKCPQNACSTTQTC